MNNSIKFFVDKKNENERVDIFLSKKIQFLTRSFIKKLIEKKNLKISVKELYDLNNRWYNQYNGFIS